MSTPWRFGMQEDLTAIGVDTSRVNEQSDPSQTKFDQFQARIDRLQTEAVQGLSQEDANLTGLTREFTEQLKFASEVNQNIQTAAGQNTQSSAKTQISSVPDVPEGEVIIGTVRLRVPPEKITVDEIPQNMEVPGLRTDGSTIIKTGKGRIQIVMDLVFSGKRDTNDRLRKLIAQFRAMPYVPVVSPYLARIVQPMVQDDKTKDRGKKLDDQIGKLNERIAATKRTIENRLESTLVAREEDAVLQAADANNQSRAEYSRIFNTVQVQSARNLFNQETENLQDIELAFERLVKTIAKEISKLERSEVVGLMQSDLFREEVKIVEELIDRLKYDMLQLHQYRSLRTQLAIGGTSGIGAGITPCCLDQIFVRPEPNNAQLTRVQLVLIYFNPVPYGGTLQYRDVLGRPTVNPDNAYFMNRYVNKTWLDKAQTPGEGSLTQEGEDYKTRRNIKALGRVAGDGSDDILTIAYGSSALSSDELEKLTQKFQDQQGTEVRTTTMTEVLQTYNPKTVWLRFNQPGTVVRYISVSMGNRLAMQPIPGEIYGSAQYLGAKPAKVAISVETTNLEFVKQLHQMKKANQHLTLSPIRPWRRTELQIANAFVNMTGVWTCQLDDLKTESVSPNTTRITIQLIEHRVDIKKREQLIRSTLFSKRTIRRILGYLFEHAQDWLERRAARADTVIGGFTSLRTLNLYRERAGQEKKLSAAQFTQFGGEDLPDSGRRAFEALFGTIRAGLVDIRTADLSNPDDFLVTFTGGTTNVTQVPGISSPQFRIDTDTNSAILTPQLLEAAFFLQEGNQRQEEGGLFTGAVDLTRGLAEALGQETPVPRNEDSAAADTRLRLQEAILRQHFYDGPAEGFKDPRPGKAEDQALGINRRYRRGIIPTDAELDLIAQYLYRGAANSSDEVSVDDNGVPTFVTKDGGASDIQGMINLAAAVFQNKVVPAKGSSIQTEAFGTGQNFEDYLAKEKRDYPSLLYPDMSLPTYAELLDAHIQGVNTDRDTQLISFNDLRPEERPVFDRLLPTYKQLGVIPPSDVRLNDYAVNFIDTVTPDVFFFKSSVINIDNEIEAAVQQELSGYTRIRERDNSGVLTDWRQDPLRAEELRELFSGPLPRVQKNRSRPTNVPNLATGKNTDFLITEAYTNGRARAELRNFGPETADNQRALFQAANANQKDLNVGMQNAFPTIRLFFIEEDSGEGNYRLIDDVYGFNSIIECHVTRHKYQPDLCELLLTNLEGNLEYDKFAPAWHGRALAGDPEARQGVSDRPNDKVGPREPHTNEKGMRNFPLSEGTRIMVQMGFTSIPDHMHTVFTGKIAQVTMGDVVRIIGQGYLQELLHPVVGKSPSEATSEIIADMLDSPSVEHFGRWTPYSWMRLGADEMENARQTNFLSTFDSRFGTFFADPKMRNVWTSKYSSWASKKFRTAVHEKWDLGDGSKTAWDVIQEVMNFSPGYVAAVLPFDLEATLFVGRPEQFYYWTDGKRREESKWIKARSKALNQLQGPNRLTTGKYFDSLFYDGKKTLNDVFAEVTGNSRDAALVAYNQQTDVGSKIYDLALQYPRWTRMLEKIAGGNNASFFLTPEFFRGASIPALLLTLDQTRIKPVITDIMDVLDHGSFGAIAPALLRATQVPALSPQYLESIESLNFQGSLLQAELRGQESDAERIRSGGATELAALLSAIENPIEFWGSIYDGQEFTIQKVKQVVDTRQSRWLRQGFSASDLEALINFIVDNRATIVTFFKSFRDYLISDPLVELAVKHSINPAKYPVNPRTKPFRNYVMLSSLDDIIENQISASREAMWNGVSIGTGGRSLTVWADDGLYRGDRILRYFNEPNADRDILNVTNENLPFGSGLIDNKYHVAASRLAQGLRFMYRGQLVCRGRPDIKPWDIAYVWDTQTMTTGPVEVERVTHHFSAQTGFITTITPHAVVVANNQIDTNMIMAQGIGTSLKYATFVGGGALLAGIAGFFIGGPIGAVVGALAGGAATKTISDSILVETTGTDLIGNMVGVGRYGGLRMPVKIIPMTRQGHPWVASLRGFGNARQDDWGFIFERFRQKALDADTAARLLWNTYRGGFDSFQKSIVADYKDSARGRPR